MLNRHIDTFHMGDDLLLFDARTKRLVLLNATARLVWEGFEQGFTQDEIVRMITQATDQTYKPVSSDVLSIVKEWSDLGLFGDKETSPPPVSNTTPSPSAHARIPINKNEQVPEKFSVKEECCFKLMDSVFSFKASSISEMDMVRPLISHLAVYPASIAQIELSLLKTNHRYLLFNKETPVDACREAKEIAPMLYAHIMMNAYEKSDSLFGIHAAAVQKENLCILLPAESGKGKSTLAASLARNGFLYCADDLVLLDKNPVRMKPVPTAMGIKSGSWEKIEPFYPEINSIPIHLRDDHKKIRYLTPDNGIDWHELSSSTFEVNYIIYPEYQPDQDFSFTKISPAQSVIKMTSAGFDIPGELDKKSLTKIVDWIKNTPSYTLFYNELEDALSLFKAFES